MPLPDGVAVKTIGAFGGGMVTTTSPHAIRDDQFELLANADTVRSTGAITTRPGYRIVQTTAATATFASGVDVNSGLNDARIRGMATYTAVDGTRQILAVSRSRLRVWNAATGVLIADAALAIRGWPSFAQYGAMMYIGRGHGANTRPAKWNGSTLFTTPGFPPPNVAPAVAAGAAGALTGTYSYKVTFLYNGASKESSSSVASASVTVAGQQIDLSSIPTISVFGGAETVTARIIYRTRSDDSTRWYRVATIADNTTTTYADNIADTALGIEIAPDDNGMPPVAGLVAIWNNRLWCTGSGIVSLIDVEQPPSKNPHNRLFFSAVAPHEIAPGEVTGIHGAHQEIFPDLFFIDIGDRSTPILGLKVLRDRLYAMKPEGIYGIFGQGPEDFAVVRATDGSGCVAPGSVVSTGNEIVYVGGEFWPTVYAFDGTSVRNLSASIQTTLEADVNTAELATALSVIGTGYTRAYWWAQAVYYRRSYYVSFSRAGESFGGFDAARWWPGDVDVYQYAFENDSWSRHTNMRAASFAVEDPGADRGRMLIGSTTGLWVYRYDGVPDDEGDATWSIVGPNWTKSAGVITQIATTVRTKQFILGTLDGWKQLKWVNLITGVSTPGATVTVRRRWDLESIGGIPDARKTQYSTVLASYQDTSRALRVRYETGPGSAVSQGPPTSTDQGYWLQLSIEADRPITIYAMQIYYVDRGVVFTA